MITTNTKGGLPMAIYWAWVFFIAEWAVRLAMLFAVPRQPQPGSGVRTWPSCSFSSNRSWA